MIQSPPRDWIDNMGRFMIGEKVYERWDLQCPNPKCGYQWDYNDDPLAQDESYETQCRECDAPIKITANYSVDYDVELIEQTNET